MPGSRAAARRRGVWARGSLAGSAGDGGAGALPRIHDAIIGKRERRQLIERRLQRRQQIRGCGDEAGVGLTHRGRIGNGESVSVNNGAVADSGQGFSEPRAGGVMGLHGGLSDAVSDGEGQSRADGDGQQDVGQGGTGAHGVRPPLQ